MKKELDQAGRESIQSIIDIIAKYNTDDDFDFYMNVVTNLTMTLAGKVALHSKPDFANQFINNLSKLFYPANIKKMEKAIIDAMDGPLHEARNNIAEEIFNND